MDKELIAELVASAVVAKNPAAALFKDLIKESVVEALTEADKVKAGLFRRLFSFLG